MPEQLIGGRYRLIKKVISGDTGRGIPDLWEAQDAGDTYFVKIWKRRKGERGEIRALWNREVRGLTRLQGYPGASEIFIKLHDLDVTDKVFYAVLDGGRRQVLSEVLKTRSRHNWLQKLSEIGRRRPIWEGLLRIAEAIAILHGEGTLHRALSSASIFVGHDGQGDFRLSGFEWSLRIAGSEGAARDVAHRNSVKAPELDKKDGEYSPGTDWFDFGLISAEIFGVQVFGENKRGAVRDAVNKLSNLRNSEKELILQLLDEDPEQRLSRAEIITQSIRSIIRGLNSATAIIGRDLVLAVRLSTDSEFQRTIEKASGGIAVAGEPEKQRKWIAYDLRGDLRITSRLIPNPHFLLRGEKLEYRVRQWAIDGLSTWDIGYCESVETNPKILTDDQHFSLGQRKLDIQLYPSVRRNYRLIRDRCVPWDKLFAFRNNVLTIPPHLKDVHDFFRVTQNLDTVLTVAQICPVHVTNVYPSDIETIIELTPIEEPERNELARHLGLQAPAEQLQDWFNLGVDEVVHDDDGDPTSDKFSLLDSRTIGGDAVPAKWRFVSAVPSPSGPRYRFRAQGLIPVRVGKWYFARNHGGTLAQIKRRHKAIEDLRFHESLLRLLASPLETSRVGTDTLPEPRTAINLDQSKAKALRDLWRVHPFFAIQGPPGTGKTTLIQAFCDRLFNLDQSAQILLTAHSHHTVDDVRTKISELFSHLPEHERPILLRLGAKNPTEHDVEPVTDSLLHRLKESPLSLAAPKFLKARIDAAIQRGRANSGETGSVDFRTMQTLVQDAANITFSTSNSAELAELADRGRRFDWSIIEEAGKAHGFDMSVAMQESHRLLMIGDHRQLPPFNARLFKDLLGDPLRIRKAIQSGVQFAPALIDASIVEEDETRDSFEERCAKWRIMVNLFETMFENSIFEEHRDSQPAATLTDQHRMHPDIADVVGKVFYPDLEGGTILFSPEETHIRFSSPPPFTLLEKSWLSSTRIVWCNVPWIQKKEFAKGETDGLFVAQKEAEVVVRVLAELVPIPGRKCSIQILSPYNNQLQAIRLNVDQAFQRGELIEMFRDPFDLKVAKRMGATVDEFQGSEADVVIVSLVRNNALPPGKSIGFLREPNRMNVLLSRSKHKLIIVGSWDFFDTRCSHFTSEDEEYEYIGRLMKALKEANHQGTLSKVDMFK